MARTAPYRSDRLVRPGRSSTLSRVVGVSAISAGAAGLVASVAGLATGSRDSGSRAAVGAASPEQDRTDHEGGDRRHDDRRRDRTEHRGSDAKGGSGAKTGTDHNGAVGGGGSSASSKRADSAPAPDDPSKPEGPEDLKKRSWLYALRKVGREFGADKCTDLAASLVYYSVLAIFPALLAIVSILGLVISPKDVSGLVAKLSGVLPGSTATLIGTFVKTLTTTNASASVVTLIVGILGALWSASGFVGAFGRAMNRVYGIDEGRPIWKLRPTQLAITVAVVVLIVIGALILALSGSVAQTIGNLIGLGPAVVFIWGIVKWPILAVIAVLTVAILYYFSPNIRQPKFKWTSTGSIIALVVWALASTAFAFYVGHFGNYNKTYGSLGGVIIFLLWLWITNIALLFGAEWDAEVERGRELQAGIAAEEDIQLPPRDTRQADKKAAKHDEDVASGRRLRESRGTDS